MKNLTLTLIAILNLLVVSSWAGARQSNINGTVNGNDQALAVTVDPASDVIAAGFTTNPSTGSDLTVIKFDGATGAELWRQVINGTADGDDRALAVTVDPEG